MGQVIPVTEELQVRKYCTAAENITSAAENIFLAPTRYTGCTGTDNLGGILNFFVSHIYLTSFGVLVNHDLDK
jgi:hypothetical protein